ncbi:hypothetical protein Hanom_Chr06g00565071 [Helianthus anomalus]
MNTCRYQPTVPHGAALRIRKRTTFEPIANTNVSDHYYNFATYAALGTKDAYT